ncbi:PAS domain-containing sensor histidine kinase [Azospirillum baldaniorum]|uniref:histidine kinase n=1 Tax=Azospirillum baldaniorum TaxID=1064539 RepID=A0A9P1JNA7_9PROT|nr:PAS domain S-box protein [Azospirillum baldaniorum]AWJ88496.1 PAS domain-containing sensor histidine kinase [Azospirillum baldaniorum]TWA79984.1 PAS domain S-box-containing protein [Azospirillum brasilense]CCC96576.1 putative histidine kinase [Azospirillum baldaniorum]
MTAEVGSVMPQHGVTDALFRTIFDSASVGMVVAAPDGRILAANPAFAHSLGYSPQDMTGRHLADVTHPEDWAWESLRFGRVMGGEAAPDPFEKRFLRADGGVMRAAMRPSCLHGPDGRPQALAMVIEDVTTVRAADEELQRSEARNRAIVEQAVETILTVDARGVILAANQAAEQLLGYDPDELAGRHITILMPPEEAAKHGAYMRRYNETGVRQVIGVGREVTALRRDGTAMVVWLSLSEIDLPGFHVFVAMLRDLSAFKAAEQALIEAKEAAELANRAKTAFLANMSHELRTPLNGILGFADVIHQQMLGSLENPMYVNFAAEIKRSGELLLANINDLLEMATIEAGQVGLEEALCDFRDVVVSCVRLVAKRAERGKLHVEADIASELPPLLADPRALKQVLLHLLSNAIKFTPEGGRIGVSARVDSAGALVAEVFDSGVGIPEDRLETVFQPFFQGDSSLARRFEGIGLGLSIAKSLVERHGGRLEIRSLEGTGTSVVIHLPKERFLTDW